jgi:predicted dehydrogenase
MRFFQAGLGSMGKRRIRCLHQLGYEDIVGFDVDADRRESVAGDYGIDIVESVESVSFDRIDAIVNSTPPHVHNEYTELAIEEETPVFVEASVVRDGLADLNERAKRTGVHVAPSCTMRFHPAVKDIKRILGSGGYGHMTNFSYHIGQYLPDWHPWEDVQDYYVSRRETGGAREMVPYALTWLTDVVGMPSRVCGFYGSTMDVGADIDDTYVINLDIDPGFGSLTVDVTSRYAVRELVINLERGQIQWAWDEEHVSVYDLRGDRWIEYETPTSQTYEGYNENIHEGMYVEELDAFIRSIRGETEFPNTLDDDLEILRLLNEVEASHD